MISNEKFQTRVQEAGAIANGGRMPEELASLIDEPIGEKEGALVFLNLGAQTLSVSDFTDLTEYEALANKIHIEDYVTGPSDVVFLAAIEFSGRLAIRLEAFGRRCKVILSEQVPGDPVVRFISLRRNTAWELDPNTYQTEAVAVWDVGSERARPNDLRSAARAQGEDESSDASK